MKIICVVGMPGSGKTTAAKILGEILGAPVVSTGDVVRDEIKRRGLKYTPETDEKISRWFHSGREDLIVRRLAKMLGPDVTVVEGLRSPEEVELLKKLTGADIRILGILLGFRKRLERLKKRKRFENVTEEYLRKRDSREVGYGLGRLIKSADFRIRNSGDLEDLRRKLEKLAPKLCPFRKL